ncbi:MAG: DUF4234 domain-containing protein, partial [Bdellovibrio sp.]|nr:DUF4234 domain-containing protein [Bdellovibrio sp.]
YMVYWFYQTAQELKIISKDSEASPTLWTLLLFVPFGNIYSYYKYSELFAKVGTEKTNKWILFILWFFFCPAVWFLVQKDLNMWSKTLDSAVQTV